MDEEVCGCRMRVWMVVCGWWGVYGEVCMVEVCGWWGEVYNGGVWEVGRVCTVDVWVVGRV